MAPICRAAASRILKVELSPRSLDHTAKETKSDEEPENSSDDGGQQQWGNNRPMWSGGHEEWSEPIIKGRNCSGLTEATCQIM